MPLNDARDEFERAYLVQVLTAARGNVSRAAGITGRYRAEFYKLLKKHGLEPADFKKEDSSFELRGETMQ